MWCGCAAKVSWGPEMTTRTFHRPPSGLSLYTRAALSSAPVIGRLPGIRHDGSGPPDQVMRRDDIGVDAKHLDEYNRICGFGHPTELPTTYPHMFVFGLQMALMTDSSFPFTPIGLVHLRNRITQARWLDPGERFSVSVHAENLRPHPKGQLIDLVSSVHSTDHTGREPVWDETMTLFSRQRAGAGQEPESPPLAGIHAPDGVVHWHLARDLGRRYASVSGDRNPIHLHPWSAKAFGFSSNIAHGMWTKARCLAALHNRLPAAFTVDVEFHKPILLPTTVVFGSERGGDDTVFGVKGTRKHVTHLVGRIRPGSAA